MDNQLSVSGLTALNSAGAPVLEDVSFLLARGERVGIIGESGSGKSVLLKAILGLLPPGLSVSRGTLRVSDSEYSLDVSASRARDALRGRVTGYVPQDPLSSLTPVRKVGSLALETLRAAGARQRMQSRERIEASFSAAGLPDVSDVLGKYPHQLSGGMRQRALIALALLTDPQFLFCDEATTALDVLAQRRVIETLIEIAEQGGKGVVLVSHDIALITEMAERVYVLYGGQVLECGPVESVTCFPGHPYTAALCDAVVEMGDLDLPKPIPGEVPDPGKRGPGCVFAPRCERADDKCRSERPPLAGPGFHQAACWHPLEHFHVVSGSDKARREVHS